MTVVDPATPRRGTAFNDRPDLQDLLDETRTYVAAETALERGGPLLPRYGLLSLLSRDTPGYVYTHPALATVCATAFTEGTHVFFYAPFLEALVESERKHLGKLERVPLWLHEVSHKLYAHHERLHNFPHAIANQAKDTSINPRIVRMLAEQHQAPGPIFGQGCGLQDAQAIERYSRLSEEQIARELMQMAPVVPAQSTDPDARAGGAEGYGAPADDHTLTLKEFIELLERNPDLGYVKGLLALPDSDDAKTLREIEQRNLAETAQKVHYAKSLMRQHGERYPGRHVDSYAVEVLDQLAEPKIAWKASLRELLAGHGTHLTYTPDYPGRLFYVDPRDMNLTSELYTGSPIPARPDSAVLVVVDTSGSVDRTLLQAFFAEVLGIVQRAGGIGEVVAYCADTALRAKPLRVTPANVSQFLKHVEVYGRGGTDFVTPLRELWAHPDIQREKRRFKALLYFTDLGARPPARRDLPADLPPLAFVTTPGCFDRGFADAVRDYARVVEIRSKTVIDLDALPRLSPAARHEPR